MSQQNFVIKQGLTVDTTEVIDNNAELTTAAFGSNAEEKIQDVVGSLLSAGDGITLDYSDVGNSLSITGNLGTITQVEAGSGLTGGGTAGHVTLNIGASTGITVNADDIAVNMGDFDTDDLGEGANNLYWTQTRFNTAFTAKDTDDLSEGTTNLYFTNERVDDRVAALLTEGSNITLTYDDTAGTLTIAAVEDYLANNDTDDLSEGSTNLYFTNERVDDRVAALLTEGDNVTLTYDDTAGTLTIATDADITGVTAGDGLSGGGTTGALTLNVDYDDSSIGLDGSNKLAVKPSGITNAMLAGSIINAKLVNSSVEINGTSVSLGGTITLDTDDIGEGSTNLYHTVERVQDVVNDQFVTNGTHIGISFSYDDAGDGAVDATVTLSPFDTDDLGEGSTNLYFTNERVDDRVDGLLVAGTILSKSYDDVNGTLTVDHDNVSRSDTTGTATSLDHEDTVTVVTGVSTSAQGHVTAIETTDYTLPAGAVPNDATITISGGTYLETGGDFTTDQGTNETITLNHSATTRSDTTSTQSPAHEGTVDVVDSVVTNATGHVTGINVKTVTLPAGAVPNDATITIAAGTALATGGDFTTDQGTNETITINHDSVSRSDTTGTATSLNHEDVVTVVTGVTSNSEGHITAIETTEYTLPAGSVPNDGTLTVQGGTDLEINTGGDSTFTADQSGASTITVDHSSVSRSNTTANPAQLSHAGTFDAITTVSTSAQGHITGVETSTFTLPAGAVPNDATITIAAGTNLTTGGDFTTDQGTNETITIDMENDITVDSVTADYIDLETGLSDPAYAEGRIFYSDEYKTPTAYVDESDVALQIGFEEWVRVYNNTGSSISDGTPVYVTGANGETPTVAPADATTEEKSRVIGLTTHTIANGSSGIVTTRGLVSGLDTSGLTAGDSVHVSSTGTLVNAAPTYPYFATDIGTCVVSDASSGYIYVTIFQHAFEQFRVTGNTHMDGNLTVEGNLNVNGTQTITNQANLAISDASIYLNSGDTIGEANTTFTGTGLDDAYFNNHYEGTTTTTYYVKIDGVGTGTGGVDTFAWSKDNFSTTEATGVDLADNVDLDNNICIHFNATTGHTLNDVWSGTAAPVNVDTGWASNRNTGTTGVGYTHMGVFFDVSDEKFKFYDEYDPEPEGEINTGHASFNLGTVKADTFEGALSGNATSASSASTATTLTGLTATIAELNKIDGFTGTVADLNYAKDLRATGVTSTEFDYLDGVTSNIQTQLDAKMASNATLDTVADNGATTNQTLTVGGISTSGNISANQITTSHTSNSGGVARNTYQSTSAPTSGDGQVGDVWIVYS